MNTNQNSVSLKMEIQKLEEKHARLQVDLESAELAHKQAREVLVHGSGETTVDSVTVTHSRVIALREAISTLDGRLQAMRDQLAAVTEAERLQHVYAEIKQREARREQARLDYLAARARANDILQEPLQAMFDARQRFNQEGRQIIDLYSSVGRIERISDTLSAPEIQPFGYEVDIAFARLGNIANREKEEQSRKERRSREQARASQRKAA